MSSSVRSRSSRSLEVAAIVGVLGVACTPGDPEFTRDTVARAADTSVGDSGSIDAGAHWSVLSSADPARGCDAEVLYSKRSVPVSEGFARLELVISDLTAVHINFELEATSAGSISRIVDPNGAVRLDGSAASAVDLTDGADPFAMPSALNWPVREIDGPLEDGTWTFEYALLGAAAHEFEVVFDVFAKRDAEPSTGCLEVVFVIDTNLLAGPSGPELLATTEAEMALVFGEQGITVQSTVVEMDLPTAPQPPSLDETGLYRELSTATSPLELLVVLSEDSSGPFAGVVAAVPGTLLASDATGALVAWSALDLDPSGTDADTATRVGQTVAHEVSHMLGLDHVVEFGPDWEVRGFDWLEDTPECLDRTDCVALLGSNLMFPAHQGLESGRSHDLTAQQVGVLHRNVAVH